MHLLDILNDKLDTLLKKYAALQAENKRLKDTIATQNLELETVKKQLASLEEGMISVHLGNTDLDENDKDNMRKQLDLVIADIDKILNTLDD
jgi:regulator of replication initiation timing